MTQTIRIWRLSKQETESDSTRYTNAKVLLVGETDGWQDWPCDTLHRYV